MKIIVTIAVLLFAVSVPVHVVTAQGAEAKPTPVTLAFQPEPGTLHEVVSEWEEVENDQTTNLSFGSQLFNFPTAVGQTVTQTRVNSLWRILDRDANGNSVIEITYKYIRSARTFGRSVDAGATFIVRDKGVAVVWDTRQKTKDANPDFYGLDEMPKNKLVEFFIRYFKDVETVREMLNRYFIDRPFRVVVDKRGQVIDVQDMDLLLDQYRTELAKLTPDFETRARQDAIVNAFLGEDSVRQSLTATQLVSFPATPIAIGQKWSDSFSFKAFGKTVPVKREFTRVQRYADCCDLDGKATYTVTSGPDQKDVLITATEDITTTIDPATGMFYELKKKGNFSAGQTAAAKNELAGSGLSAMRFDQSTRVSQVAVRSATDKSKWRFYGGYEDFYIYLGESWYRSEPKPNEPFRVFFSDGKASLATEILAPGISREYKRVLRTKEDLPAFLEEYAKLPLTVKTSALKPLRTFKTGDVEWFRGRLDIFYDGNFTERHLVQGGFDGKRFFIFLLSTSLDDFEARLNEGIKAFDSIEIRPR